MAMPAGAVPSIAKITPAPGAWLVVTRYAYAWPARTESGGSLVNCGGVATTPPPPPVELPICSLTRWPCDAPRASVAWTTKSRDALAAGLAHVICALVASTSVIDMPAGAAPPNENRMRSPSGSTARTTYVYVSPPLSGVGGVEVMRGAKLAGTNDSLALSVIS